MTWSHAVLPQDLYIIQFREDSINLTNRSLAFWVFSVIQGIIQYFIFTCYLNSTIQKELLSSLWTFIAVSKCFTNFFFYLLG